MNAFGPNRECCICSHFFNARVLSEADWSSCVGGCGDGHYLVMPTWIFCVVVDEDSIDDKAASILVDFLQLFIRQHVKSRNDAHFIEFNFENRGEISIIPFDCSGDSLLLFEYVPPV